LGHSIRREIGREQQSPDVIDTLLRTTNYDTFGNKCTGLIGYIQGIIRGDFSIDEEGLKEELEAYMSGTRQVVKDLDKIVQEGRIKREKESGFIDLKKSLQEGTKLSTENHERFKEVWSRESALMSQITDLVEAIARTIFKGTESMQGLAEISDNLFSSYNEYKSEGAGLINDEEMTTEQKIERFHEIADELHKQLEALERKVQEQQGKQKENIINELAPEGGRVVPVLRALDGGDINVDNVREILRNLKDRPLALPQNWQDPEQKNKETKNAVEDFIATVKKRQKLETIDLFLTTRNDHFNNEMGQDLIYSLDAMVKSLSVHTSGDAKKIKQRYLAKLRKGLVNALRKIKENIDFLDEITKAGKVKWTDYAGEKGSPMIDLERSLTEGTPQARENHEILKDLWNRERVTLMQFIGLVEEAVQALEALSARGEVTPDMATFAHGLYQSYGMYSRKVMKLFDNPEFRALNADERVKKFAEFADRAFARLQIAGEDFELAQARVYLNNKHYGKARGLAERVLEREKDRRETEAGGLIAKIDKAHKKYEAVLAEKRKGEEKEPGERHPKSGQELEVYYPKRWADHLDKDGRLVRGYARMLLEVEELEEFERIVGLRDAERTDFVKTMDKYLPAISGVRWLLREEEKAGNKSKDYSLFRREVYIGTEKQFERDGKAAEIILRQKHQQYCVKKDKREEDPVNQAESREKDVEEILSDLAGKIKELEEERKKPDRRRFKEDPSIWTPLLLVGMVLTTMGAFDSLSVVGVCAVLGGVFIPFYVYIKVLHSARKASFNFGKPIDKDKKLELLERCLLILGDRYRDKIRIVSDRDIWGMSKGQYAYTDIQNGIIEVRERVVKSSFGSLTGFLALALILFHEKAEIYLAKFKSLPFKETLANVFEIGFLVSYLAAMLYAKIKAFLLVVIDALRELFGYQRKSKESDAVALKEKCEAIVGTSNGYRVHIITDREIWTRGKDIYPSIDPANKIVYVQESVARTPLVVLWPVLKLKKSAIYINRAVPSLFKVSFTGIVEFLFRVSYRLSNLISEIIDLLVGKIKDRALKHEQALREGISQKWYNKGLFNEEWFSKLIASASENTFPEAQYLTYLKRLLLFKKAGMPFAYLSNFKNGSAENKGLLGNMDETQLRKKLDMLLRNNIPVKPEFLRYSVPKLTDRLTLLKKHAIEPLETLIRIKRKELDSMNLKELGAKIKLLKRYGLTLKPEFFKYTLKDIRERIAMHEKCGLFVSDNTVRYTADQLQNYAIEHHMKTISETEVTDEELDELARFIGKKIFVLDDAWQKASEKALDEYKQAIEGRGLAHLVSILTSPGTKRRAAYLEYKRIRDMKPEAVLIERIRNFNKIKDEKKKEKERIKLRGFLERMGLEGNPAAKKLVNSPEKKERAAEFLYEIIRKKAGEESEEAFDLLLKNKVAAMRKEEGASLAKISIGELPEEKRKKILDVLHKDKIVVMIKKEGTGAVKKAEEADLLAMSVGELPEAEREKILDALLDGKINAMVEEETAHISEIEKTKEAELIKAFVSKLEEEDRRKEVLKSFTKVGRIYQLKEIILRESLKLVRLYAKYPTKDILARLERIARTEKFNPFFRDESELFGCPVPEWYIGRLLSSEDAFDEIPQEEAAKRFRAAFHALKTLFPEANPVPRSYILSGFSYHLRNIKNTLVSSSGGSRLSVGILFIAAATLVLKWLGVDIDAGDDAFMMAMMMPVGGGTEESGDEGEKSKQQDEPPKPLLEILELTEYLDKEERFQGEQRINKAEFARRFYEGVLLKKSMIPKDWTTRTPKDKEYVKHLLATTYELALGVLENRQGVKFDVHQVPRFFGEQFIIAFAPNVRPGVEQFVDDTIKEAGADLRRKKEFHIDVPDNGSTLSIMIRIRDVAENEKKLEDDTKARIITALQMFSGIKGIKDRVHEAAISILRTAYPKGKEEDIRTFIKEFEDEETVPVGPRKGLIKIVQAAESLLTYTAEIVDTYSLLKIHRKNKGQNTAHFYIYNPEFVGSASATRVIVAAEDKAGIIGRTDIVSNLLPGVKIDLVWQSMHNNKQQRILYFNVTDKDTGVALTEEAIKNIYKNLQKKETTKKRGMKMMGVRRKHLRASTYKATMEEFGFGSSEVKERMLETAEETPGARIAEGYAYVLPKIRAAILEDMMSLPWDSDQLVKNKQYKAIRNLVNALDTVTSKHTDKTAGDILTALGDGEIKEAMSEAVSWFWPARANEPSNEAKGRLCIIVRGVIRKTLRDGKNAKKIRNVLKSIANQEMSDYQKTGKQDTAKEIWNLTVELEKAYLTHRKSIQEEDVASEQKKLRKVIARRKEVMRQRLQKAGMPEVDIVKLEMQLDDNERNARVSIEEKKVNAAEALYDHLREREELFEKMHGGGNIPEHIYSSFTESITQALPAVGELESIGSIGGYMREENLRMEKDFLSGMIVELEKEMEQKGANLPFSSGFLKILKEKGAVKIEKEEMTAVKAVNELMEETIEPEMSDTEKAAIETTANIIIERYVEIQLLDDAHELVKGEKPLIIVTDSLDLLGALRLFEQSPQIAGIIINRDKMTSHGASLASGRVPVLPSVKGKEGEKATTSISTNDPIIIEEEEGKVYVNPGLNTRIRTDVKKAEFAVLQKKAVEGKNKPAITQDEVSIDFAIDMTEPMDYKEAFDHGSKNVRLLRLEILYQERAPTEEELADLIVKIADETDGEVDIRMFDLQPDKKPAYMKITKGHIGTKYLLSDEGARIAIPSARAIIKAYYRSKAYRRSKGKRGNINIFFPMVENGQEARQAREFILKRNEEIIDEAKRNKKIRDELKIVPEEEFNMRIGGMIESVCAVNNRDEIVKHFNFISVGTKDLVKSIRGSYSSSKRFPLALIKYASLIYETTSRENKRLSFCGEWAGHVETILTLLNVSKEQKGKLTVVVKPIFMERLKEIARNADIGKIFAKLKEFILAPEEDVPPPESLAEQVFIKKEKKLDKILREEAKRVEEGATDRAWQEFLEERRAPQEVLRTEVEKKKLSGGRIPILTEFLQRRLGLSPHFVDRYQPLAEQFIFVPLALALAYSLGLGHFGIVLGFSALFFAHFKRSKQVARPPRWHFGLVAL
ncbi:putative PEP-binding protein, partial [Candidatus Omnitrophota bacterium]